MPDIRIESLHYYPIKSCGGIETPTARVSELGLEHDREWMLIGKNNQFISQRTHPELATVLTANIDDTIFAQAPGQGVLELPKTPDLDSPVIPINLFKKPGAGTYAGRVAEEYFSDFLGRHARLIQLRHPRHIKPECRVEGAADQTGFADGFPILLASTTSLAALNRHIKETIPMNRFRPNIVVSGAPEYDEDTWREIRIGKMRAHVVRACARCPVPDIDQKTGQPASERPVTQALRSSRKGIDPVNNSSGEFFGQHLAHMFWPGTTLRVGDEVSITRNSEPNIKSL